MDRCALFVDAGYLLADGAMAVHGTRHREAVSWDFSGLLQLLGNLARERSGMPLLRCYWYEATVEGRRATEHEALADLPGLKLRLGRARPGRREGVDTEIHRDLMTLARNSAVADAIVVSGDEDLVQIIADAQDLGVRVTVVHVAVDGNWTIARALRQECDDLIEIGAGHLRPYVNLLAGFDPAAGSLSNGNGNGVNGHGTGSNGVMAPLRTGVQPNPPQSSPLTASPLSAPLGGGLAQNGAGSGLTPAQLNAQRGLAATQAQASLGARGMRPGTGSQGLSPGYSPAGSGSDLSTGPQRPGQGGPLQSGPLSANGAQSRSLQSGPLQPNQLPSNPLQSGPLPTGPLQNGSLQSGPMPNGSLQNGSLQNGPLQSGPSQSGPLSGGYANGSALPSGALPVQQTGANARVPAQNPGLTSSQGLPVQYNASGAQPQVNPYGGSGQLSPVSQQQVQQQQNTPSLSEAVKAAHQEGQDFGESVARDAPALWLEAVLARKPRMPSDLEARLLQGSNLPIDYLLHDEVRHALRRGFWDSLERSRR